MPPQARWRAPPRRSGTALPGRPSDVFGGELRRRDIFTLLVLHLIARSESGASYGNQLIEQIEAITAGAVSLNPNTMYPLLRELESAGFIEGRWEHPEKRSRRLYTLTAEGRGEYERLEAGPRAVPRPDRRQHHPDQAGDLR